LASKGCDGLNLERHFVIDRVQIGFAILESASVCLDEFDGVADDLECAAVLSVIRNPLVLVQDSGNGDPGSLVEIRRADFRELMKRDDLDPAGFLLAGLKCEAKRCDGISLR